MGRMYTVLFKAVAVTAQQDFIELTAPSDSILKIHEWELSQVTEVGDAAEEQLQVTVNRGIGSTSGSGGSAATPQPLDDGDAAAGFTAEVNNTTKMSVGTIEEIFPQCWNVRMPFTRIYTPETRPVVGPSELWTLELETTPADSITISGYVTVEEIGG